MIAPVLSSKALGAKPASCEKQVTDCVRRLHRWDDAEFCEAWDVWRTQVLRVLDPPAWLSHLPLVRRDGLQGCFIQVENSPVRAISDRVRLHLNAVTQSFLKNHAQVLFFARQKTGRVRVRILLQERGAA